MSDYADYKSTREALWGNYDPDNNKDRNEIEICVEFVCQTDAAILVTDGNDMNGDDVKVWIPKSQIRDCSEDYDNLEKGQSITVTLPEWLAEDKGLI